MPSGLEAAEALESEADLRRSELEGLLRDGAWTEAFNEWAEYTDLTEAEYQSIREAGLFDELDFFWDPIEERLEFALPSMPDA